MSPTARSFVGRLAARHLARHRDRDDEGFTLVEIMVAMIVFALFVSAALGMLVGALRTAALTKDSTSARQVAQADFEKLKGLVFQASGSTPTVLSTYYPNLTATSTRGTTGYVSAASTTRWTADGDPATGAFYRTVLTSAPTAPAYTRYLAVQFVDSSGVAIATIPATYSPTALPLPSTTVRATETVLWNRIGQHTYTMQSELTTGAAAPEQASGSATITAVRLSGLDAIANPLAPVKVALEGPSLSLRGALTDNAVASVAASGADGTNSLGAHSEGSTGLANAPGDTTASSTSASAGTLAGSGVTPYGTFGPSTTSGLSAQASYARPRVSTSSAPSTTTLAAGNGSTPALTMTTLTTVSDAPAKLQLSSTDIARATIPSCGGCTTFTSTGYLSSADNGITHSVDASVSTTGAAGIGLFPTSFAPQGVVILQLDSATLTCHVGGTYPSTSPGTVTATYSGSIKYWTGNGTTGSYTTVALSNSNSTSPLAGISLATTQVWTYAGAPVYLSDYISSWGSATTSALSGMKQSTPNDQLLSAKLDGFITVTTAGVQATAPTTSSLTAQLGIVACSGADAR